MAIEFYICPKCRTEVPLPQVPKPRGLPYVGNIRVDSECPVCREKIMFVTTPDLSEVVEHGG